jgi:hypothetical protein
LTAAGAAPSGDPAERAPAIPSTVTYVAEPAIDHELDRCDDIVSVF